MSEEVRENDGLVTALTTDHHHHDHFTMIDVAYRRERRSLIIGDTGVNTNIPVLHDDTEENTNTIGSAAYGSIEDGQNDEAGDDCKNRRSSCRSFAAQIPAVAVASLFILMGAVPFGVAYFPIGWKDVSSASFDEDDRESQDDGIEGSFPLPAKAALGIRMCLFSTLVGQLAMTFTSTFSNPVVFQLVENVPFYHALARIVITEQGYGIDALTTLFFLFGLGSVLVGLSFYLVGKFRLGRIVYFFPSHVLLGCIAGIAVFVIKTAVEVTISTTVSYDLDGLLKFMDKWHHFAIVVCFEVVLRVLAAVLTGPRGEPRFPLLSPIYFCSIIPVFYLALKILDVDLDRARAEGYFLPDPVASCGFAGCEPTTFYDRVFDGHIWDIFTIPLNFKAISWTAVGKSVGTLVSMAAFSFLQVPIMIPAFAVSSNVEIDMDAELIAHGWSNGLSGLFGGLQNVMTYSISILYHKSGGYGKASSLAIIALTGAMFVIGPAMAAFIPRAMAGTLLLHIGVDLLLEGVYDTFGVYDALEYSGVSKRSENRKALWVYVERLPSSSLVTIHAYS